MSAINEKREQREMKHGGDKVFCKDCRHRYIAKRQEIAGELGVRTYRELTDECGTEPRVHYDPIAGKVLQRVKCHDRNRVFDCKLFEPSPPPKSFWSWLFSTGSP